METTEFNYNNVNQSHTNRIVWNAVLDILNKRNDLEKRVFELGCGNGSTADMLSREGFSVSGVDASESGVAIANKTFPHLDLSVGNAYDDLASEHGTFPIVVSLDVIEHCYSPGKFLETFYGLLDAGGCGIISTPYHGYMKNLVLALSGKMDSHFTALWEGGHIKFFSVNSLDSILSETGFRDVKFQKIGRIPPLAKSLVAVFSK